jgi:hypothetical protein
MPVSPIGHFGFLVRPLRRSRGITMLSPHEFATLLLVKDSPDQLDMDRGELDALLEHQLIELEKLASGSQRLVLTESGVSTVRAIKRYS